MLNFKNILDAFMSSKGVNKPDGGEIYRIWFDNDPSGMCYVGQTIQGSLERIKQHIADAQNGGNGGCPLLDEATRRFGVNAMRYEVLESGITTHEELDEAERFWIKKYGSQYPNGYNVKSGGQGAGATYATVIDNSHNGGFLQGVISAIGSKDNRAASEFVGDPLVGILADAVMDRMHVPEKVQSVVSRFV